MGEWRGSRGGLCLLLLLLRQRWRCKWRKLLCSGCKRGLLLLQKR